MYGPQDPNMFLAKKTHELAQGVFSILKGETVTWLTRERPVLICVSVFGYNEITKSDIASFNHSGCRGR